MLTTITVPSEQELTQRKLETYAKYIRLLNWGRRRPVEFAERIMGVELLDYQKYILLGSWTSEFIAWLVCRNGGKTTEAGIYTMLRSLLLPYHATYFLGNTGEQSKEVFGKIEKIAKREIESFTGSTQVFMDEVRNNSQTGDGFSHNPASYRCELFNGSTINTLNSSVVGIKGKRANLVVFDESGWFPDELFVQAEQFTNQSEDFKLGGNIDLTEEPRNFPRQLLYCSSASDTESCFYHKVRSFTKEMMMGNTKYFVCNLNADMIKKATRMGKRYPSLLNQSKIDHALKDNLEKAQRELYNHFSSETHEGQILTRRHLLQHTKPYLPIYKNEDGKRIYLLGWDSARLNDGSIIIVAELINDPDIGWRMELKNIFALVDPTTKKNTPMRMPDQVKMFQKILLDFNGTIGGKLDYENINRIVIDAGPAGQPYSICDNLVPNFTGIDGNEHKGILDAGHKLNEAAVHDFPDAVDLVTMVDPRGHRNEVYQALEDMVKLGVVSFPMEYDGKDYITVSRQKKRKAADGQDVVEEEEELQMLTDEEKISLMQFELLKTECVTMCKYENGGNVRFDYPPEKRNKMHDDRCYSFSLLCWYLAKLRRNQTLSPKAKERSYDDLPLLVDEIAFD